MHATAEPIPIYVNRLPPSPDLCGQPLREELASTLLDVWADKLQDRWAYCLAMHAQLGTAAQERNRAAIEGVRHASERLSRIGKTDTAEEDHTWVYCAEVGRDLGRKLAVFEDRIWTELKRLARAEDKEDEAAALLAGDGDGETD